MRIPDGLTRSELEAFHRALGRSHYQRARVIVLDRDETEVTRLVPRILTGSVDVDADALPSRTADLEFVDHAGAFDWAPSSPAQAAAFVDTFLRVELEIHVEELGRWVSVPVIHGPIATISRKGPIVTAGVDGKETLAVAPAVLWTDPGDVREIGRGTPAIEAIRRLLRAQGERRFDFPETPRRSVGERISLDRMAEPWKVATKLAKSINRQLFYDGAGTARLRSRPADRVFAFVFGEPTLPSSSAIANVLSRPELAFDRADLRNVVEALGPQPEGKGKRRRRYTAIAHGDLSAGALQRNGEPRWLVERIELEEAKRDRDVREAAEAELRRRATVSAEVTFEALVAPHLEELDPVALWLDGEWQAFTLRKFSVPLTAGEVGSIGFNRRISSRRRGRRG